VGTVRRWLWLRFTREGRSERAAAKRYWAMLEQGRPQILAVAARIKACSPHPNREPDPRATAAVERGWNPERCLDCGTGILNIPRRAPSEDAR
jgi:hypothetical protein